MRLLQLPWFESAILIALLGSLAVSRLRAPERAALWGMCFTGIVFLCSFLAWLSFHLHVPTEPGDPWSLQARLLGHRVIDLDELSAPLVPAIALLHFLTAVATARTRMRHFSFSWSLVSEAIRLAMLGAPASWLLVALMIVSIVPPYIELRNRNESTRVYSIHMALFVVLLVTGWAAVQAQAPGDPPPIWGIVPLLLAILVRLGTVPVHCWVTGWLEHASLGNAILYITPLTGVYAAVRFVLPIAPEWVLRSIGLASLATAVYASAMATVQTSARRFFAYLFLSLASLVLVGLELTTELSLTASFSLWFAVMLSLGGFGLALRSLEARFGTLGLVGFHGLYGHAPTLAVCFLLTGLASVGFPATLGFVSTELLVDSAVEANIYVGIAVITSAALNGIAVLRAYLHLFTGSRHVSTVSLRVGVGERFALLTLAALVLGGGLFPQPGVATRWRAASLLLEQRNRRLDPAPVAVPNDGLANRVSPHLARSPRPL
jgi:NADH-quinone oxidoreductase subunit M